MNLLLYHMTGFALGIILDLFIGDPMNFPHPIRLIGGLISKLDHRFMDGFMKGTRDVGAEKRRGLLLSIIVVFLTGAAAAVLLFAAYAVHVIAGIAAEAVMTCYILAAKSLKDESMKVMYALDNKGLEESRYAVSMIVGRDTKELDRSGIARAAVETVAENTSDGIIAPLIYTCIGGPVLGFIYKAINTMDSMVAYHSDRYENFGFVPARLDDAAGFIPSRLSALLMIAAAYLLPGYSGEGAARVFKRDRFNHKSPNSAQTESACAGALGLRLAGPASYFGRLVDKPYIGDELREIEAEDIKRSCRLMFATEGLCVLLLYAVMITLYLLLN